MEVLAIVSVTSAGAGPMSAGAEVRSIDGSNNHPAGYGATLTPLRRVTPAAYYDGVSVPAGVTRANPRTISNLVVAQTGSIPNSMGVTSMVFQWGQFLDHDIDLTGAA